MKARISGSIKLLLLGAIMLVVGILIMNNSGLFIKILLVAAGIGTLLDGIYTLIGALKWKYTKGTKFASITKGVLSIAIGIAAIVVSINSTGDAVRIMVYVFAASLILSAIVSFENAFVAGRFNTVEMRSHFITEGVVSLVVAVVLFIIPNDIVDTLVKILAIAFIVVGSLIIAAAVIGFLRKSKGSSANVGEAEVVDKN